MCGVNAPSGAAAGRNNRRRSCRVKLSYDDNCSQPPSVKSALHICAVTTILMLELKRRKHTQRSCIIYIYKVLCIDSLHILLSLILSDIPLKIAITTHLAYEPTFHFNHRTSSTAPSISILQKGSVPMREPSRDKPYMPAPHSQDISYPWCERPCRIRNGLRRRSEGAKLCSCRCSSVGRRGETSERPCHVPYLQAWE